jgi:integrase
MLLAFHITNRLQIPQNRNKSQQPKFVLESRKVLLHNLKNKFIMEGIEKVICCDKGNDALAYAAMANKQTDPMAMAAMMNGGMGNQWMNNPFAYMMFLALFGGAGFGGFGNRGNAVQDAEIQNQIASLRSQMADNHNADLLMLVDFDTWMQAKGNSVNTRSIHLRNLRALFNEAIREDYVAQEFYPFRKFRIKSEQTEKRSLTIKELLSLMNFKCEDYQQKYIDIFLISFYCAGINMVDLLDLPHPNEEQRITYRRSKTGVLCSLKIPNEAMKLIRKYRGEKKLLNFGETHEDKRSFVRTINKNLQKIGKTDIINVRNRYGRVKKEKIFKPLFPHLTTYWARHTWATIAADIDIPDAVIDAALGHKPQYQIADIYIRRNEKKVDQAIKKVIDYVKKSTDN